MAALARGGSLAIATAASVAFSSHLSSPPSLADNGEHNNNTNNFRQLSVQEVNDTARTIFRGKNDNPTNGNLSIASNNSVQVFHQNLPLKAIELGTQLAQDPKVQQALYENLAQKWAIVGKGGFGVEKEVHLSDDEDDEPGLRSPILSDIEDSDYSHLSRNQVIISPELFAAVHQILPPSTAPADAIPASPIHPPQQVPSPPSASTISSNSNDGKEEGGVIDRLVRWIGSFFSPNPSTTQQNSPPSSSSASTSTAASSSSSASSTSTSSDPLSSIKNFVGSIEIYQMAIAVAAVIVFAAIFKRPPPKFF